jgi:hypothetical protein
MKIIILGYVCFKAMHIQSSYWLYMVAIGHIHLISFPFLNVRGKKKGGNFPFEKDVRLYIFPLFL